MPDRMDGLAVIALVTSIAGEHESVGILQELLQVDKNNIHVESLEATDGSAELFRLTFDNKSVLLKVGCLVSTHENQETCLEYESLIAHEKLCPHLTPHVYCWNEQHKAVLLEDIVGYANLFEEIASGKVDMAAVRKLGSAIGQIHQQSHTAANSVVARDLLKTFGSLEMDNRIVQRLFVDPFDQNHIDSLPEGQLKNDLRKVASDDTFMASIASLKKSLLHRKECLGHGFLSTASVGVKDGDAKILTGFNGTFMGPCAFDIAQLLADYILFYHEHMLTELDNDAHRQVAYKMVNACDQTVEAYLEQMTVTVGDREQYHSRILSDVAGYCGVGIIARAAQRSLENAESLSKAGESIQSGIRLVRAAHRIHSSSLLTNIALMLTF